MLCLGYSWNMWCLLSDLESCLYALKEELSLAAWILIPVQDLLCHWSQSSLGSCVSSYDYLVCLCLSSLCLHYTDNTPFNLHCLYHEFCLYMWCKGTHTCSWAVNLSFISNNMVTKAVYLPNGRVFSSNTVPFLTLDSCKSRILCFFSIAYWDFSNLSFTTIAEMQSDNHNKQNSSIRACTWFIKTQEMQR